MSLPTSAKLTPLDPTRPRRELTFMESPVASKQARFQNRRMLIPEIDLKKYRFKAVIDYVVVRVFTDKTQHQWIQKALRTVLERDSWISPVNPGAGKESDEFDIKIQEPSSAALVAAAIEAVSKERGERRAPELREIEFSLDVYSRGGDEQERDKMVGLLQRTYFAETTRWQDDMDMPRTIAMNVGESDPKTETSYLTPEMGAKRNSSLNVRPGADEFRSPFVEGTMYLGAKDTSGMIRIQNKVRDQQYPEKGTFNALAADQARARVEVTLKSCDLELFGLRELRDLKGFSYAKLQKKYFQFMLPTFACEDPEKSSATNAVVALGEHKRADVFLKSGILALLRRDEVWENHKASERPKVKKVFRLQGWTINQSRTGSGSRSTMISYDLMNKEVATAFRHLGERDQRAWARGERSSESSQGV
ncbi:hypothetical protein OO012_06540 [Rhodobacteraceae bacterium KMM 6894]|nr:hypothetical protein [Rhodobacteraceae bacterium KMM 6894]